MNDQSPKSQPAAPTGAKPQVMPYANVAVAATPMMAQYIEIKAANPDSLLFYRMGDFYELFFDDAVEASRALGITLTKRGKHMGEDIPMCGVPFHAADDYLQKLIRLGFRVAVCEQTEDPAEAKKRGTKAVVKRDVMRLVTPGTITEEKLLDPSRSNFLCALARIKGSDTKGDDFALAWIDISTGAFRLAHTDSAKLAADLARIEPSELVLPDAVFHNEALRSVFDEAGFAVTPQPGSFFESTTAEKRLCDFYGVETLDGFGTFSRVELAAASGILAYVEKTQLNERPRLQRPVSEDAGAAMFIDAATRANLELTKTMSGERNGSLLKSIDRTVTGAGSRLLTEHLMNPLTVPRRIADRQDAIALVLTRSALMGNVRSILKSTPDLLRALSRLSVNRGGPRDLAAIGIALQSVSELIKELAPLELPEILKKTRQQLEAAPFDFAKLLSRALLDDMPLLKREGGFVREGFDEALDELRALRDESRRVIAGLQAQYSQDTEVKNLKIKHNNMLGYFIEVNASNADALTQSDEAKARFIHRQTMANAMRFTTTELSELESKIANAGGRALSIELEIFDRLADEAIAHADAINDAAYAMAQLDVTAALATLAEEQGYVRPRVDDSLAFDVKAGRHPVVEQMLRKQAENPFVANDCDIGPAQDSADTSCGNIWLLTGPNMGGKSTFLRQNALIAILAQMGSFVPAGSAHIGVVDRLFSRVGAADDLARGRSTFMVEMIETAAILNQASERSLVILDEIGRGTATFDGLSIAWATIENLHEVNRCRTLFATHYHELTALSEPLDRLVNVTLKVKEWEGDVIFLHEVIPGAADRSYGIQVAKLAGLPASVVDRAKDVLEQLEASDRKTSGSTLVDDLPLFSVSKAASDQASMRSGQGSELTEKLSAINPDELTPREALEALYRLKQNLTDKS